MWHGVLAKSLGVFLLVALASAARGDVVADFVAHVRANPDGVAPASFPLPDAATADLPIGVFDSGVGGLTVLEAILRLDEVDNATGAPGADGKPDLAGERFLYLGDQANMPYGNYGAAGKEEFLRGLILQDVAFLLDDRRRAAAGEPASLPKPAVKAIVIACNTATAYGLDDIRRALAELGLDIPVVGVVEAGSRGVVADLARGGDPRSYAVMATVGTCSSNAYPRTIARLTREAGQDSPEVVQQGAVALAGAIEGERRFLAGAHPEGTYDGPSASSPKAPLRAELAAAYGFEPEGLRGDPADPTTWTLASVTNHVRYEVLSAVEAHRAEGLSEPIGGVVLGCTHFPLVADEIVASFARLRAYEAPDGSRPYADVVAANVAVIDPAADTARELVGVLSARGLRRIADESPAVEAYWSVANPALPGVELDAAGGLATAYKYGRTGRPWEREDTVVVPLTLDVLPESARNLVIGSLPATAAALGGSD